MHVLRCITVLFSTLTLANSYKTYFPPLLDADFDDLITGLESGSFTSVDLVKAYTARILEVNSTLHVVTELNPDALAIAEEADARRAKGRLLGPLDGLPILIKNNIATNDKMNNTAGSWSLVGSKVPRDSTMAAKLRKAGAVILGRLNLSQWANFRSENSSNGWSAHGGQTYGAYYPGQDPSGSSSGSGVASSLGLAAGSLGTETSGSILAPADVNNVVGIKPTVGLTSRYLVIPISEHQDTIGPMTRTVKDAAYLLQAIAGIDDHDNYTSAIPNKGNIPDYVAACDYNALAGKRIGVARNVLELWGKFVDQPVLDAFDIAVQQIKDAGATIVDANFTAFEQWQRDGNQLSLFYADFQFALRKYLAELTFNPNNLNDLADVTEYTHNNPLEDWPHRDTGIWDAALKQGWENTAPEFWPVYQKCLFFGGEGGVLGALERTNTSAILLPTQLSPPVPAMVGSPVVSVPMGFLPEDWEVSLNRRNELIAGCPNLPFGLSFMGAKWSEAELIGLAYAYEQRTMHRFDSQPYFAPNYELGDVVGKLSRDKKPETCTKDWMERSLMFERWPNVMKEQGAPQRKQWWSKLLEDGLGSDVEVTPKTEMEET